MRFICCLMPWQRMFLCYEPAFGRRSWSYKSSEKLLKAVSEMPQPIKALSKITYVADYFRNFAPCKQKKKS